MIGFLRGRLLEKNNRWIIGVGANLTDGSAGCVGYLVNVPNALAYQQACEGDWISLKIHSHVREDAFELFGFLTSVEKEMFLSLISVSGIGPKMALGLLSHVSVADLLRAIQGEEKATLTRLPGIGQKTAERIVLELRESLQKKVHAGVFSAPLSAEDMRPFDEARDALVALGYRDTDVRVALKQIKKSSKVEDLVRSALQQMSRS